MGEKATEELGEIGLQIAAYGATSIVTAFGRRSSDVAATYCEGEV